MLMLGSAMVMECSSCEHKQGSAKVMECSPRWGLGVQRRKGRLSC